MANTSRSVIWGTLGGLAIGIAVGFSTTVWSKGAVWTPNTQTWGVNPHFSVKKECLEAIEHLVNPKAVGEALNKHFPSGTDLVHKAGGGIKNNAAGGNYTYFLELVDDVRDHHGLPKIALTGTNYNDYLGEHVLEGLCVK